MTTKKQSVEIPALNVKYMTMTIESDTRLVTHAWAEKAKKEIRDKQQKKARNKKEARDTWAEFCGSMYWLTPMPNKPTEADIKKAKFGVPAIALKKAAVTACTSVGNITKVAARQAFHVCGNNGSELIPIEAPAPTMREDTVRIGMGLTDLRYRGEFPTWKLTFKVRYNEDVISAEQLIHLFNIAGFAVGIMENRPEKNGDWGMFHVETNGGSKA